MSDMKPVGEVSMRVQEPPENIDSFKEAFTEAFLETSEEEVRTYADQLAEEAKKKYGLPRNSSHVTVHDGDILIEQGVRWGILKVFGLEPEKGEQ